MSRTEIDVSAELYHFGRVNENNIAQFENLITEAMENSHESLILPLMLTLDDTCDFDEIMFGVIHGLEKFPWGEYSDNLAKNLHLINEKAPRWCAILHIRIINSPSAYTDFLKRFSNVNERIRMIEKEILVSLSIEDRFRDRCLIGIRQLEAM